MVGNGPTLLDLVYSPQIETGRVDEGQTGDDGKSPSGSKSERVTKVEQRGGNGADENGEFEPREKRALRG
jgi:hypothetical protein